MNKTTDHIQGFSQSQTMRIRSLETQDVAMVVELFTASVHGLSRDHYDNRQLAAWAPTPPNLDEWQERLNRSTTLVAECGSILTGFISYEGDGHIDLLYTLPGYERRGVASALYQHAEAAMRTSGYREIFTEASLSARTFFENQGFRVVEKQMVTRRNVIFDRLLMKKTINPGGNYRKSC